MNETPSTKRLDEYTQFTELGSVVHGALQRGIPAIALLIVALSAFLFFTDSPGWASLLWMGAGTLVALSVWQNKGVGLPLVPMLAMQQLLTYATPIVNGSASTGGYPTEYLTTAGFEVFVFLCAMSAAWRLGMALSFPKTSYSYALKAFSSHGLARTAIGVYLVLAITVYNVLDGLNYIWLILELLPAGTYSFVSALMKAATIAGFFILSMCVGSGDARPAVKVFFWTTLALNAVLTASSLLLSSVTNLMAAVVIGLFWSSGRLPWRLIGVASALLAFLHMGKFDMRERYWNEGVTVSFGLEELPSRYAEWVSLSMSNIVADEPPPSAFGTTQKKDRQSMLERVNNLQNLLFAIHAIEGQSLPVLEGKTYKLIPPLLLPRILWPEKPRAHEGQVLLNVHFGRQTLNATLTTYVAWGLLAEAYGNFGPVWGAAALGIFLGLLFAWIENVTACKPLLSLEGLVTLALFVEFAVSFEMVASVLVTALFQSGVIISMACLPFVHRTLVVRAESGGAAA